MAKAKSSGMSTLRFLIFRIVFHMFEADGFPVEIGVNHTETFFSHMKDQKWAFYTR